MSEKKSSRSYTRESSSWVGDSKVSHNGKCIVEWCTKTTGHYSGKCAPCRNTKCERCKKPFTPQEPGKKLCKACMRPKSEGLSIY